MSQSVLEARLRTMFKYINRMMMLFWRLGFGRWMSSWPSVGGRIMVLTTIGRVSGQQRRTPLNYALIDGVLYCTAGFGSISDWYRNMRVNPAVEVWLPDGRWAGVASDISSDPARLRLLREVLIGSGIVAPLMGVNPHTLSDTALATLTANYHLVRIDRTTIRTGAGGPGDLAWIWPLSAAVLFLLWLARRIFAAARRYDGAPARQAPVPGRLARLFL